MLAYLIRRFRLLSLAHSVVGHDDLEVRQSSGRIWCRSCGTIISPGRSV